MIENPVLQVEIEEFSVLRKVAELEKPVEISNLNWTLGAFSECSARTNHVSHLGLVLHCNKTSRSNLWSATASIELRLVKTGSESESFTKNVNFEFKFGRQTLEVPDFLNWNVAICPENGFVVDDTAVVEARIHVRHVDGIHLPPRILETFDVPRGDLSDVELVVEEKSLFVGKQILALHSHYFSTLFYSNFREKSASKIHLPDVSHSEFVDLLNFIYPSRISIDDHNFRHILKLADRFQVAKVLEKCEKFLIENQAICLVSKLKYAENYRFSELQDRCLETLKTSQQVLDLSKKPEYSNLGGETRNLLNQILFETMQN